MDWLTSLLQGQPGVGTGGIPGVPTPPANTMNPFDPTNPAVTPAPTGGGTTANMDNQPGAGNPQQKQDNSLISALRGASAPSVPLNPNVVKPSTPGQPVLKTIKSGELMALLNQVSNPRVARPAATTLGGALGTGRY